MPESKYVSGRDGASRGSYTLVTDAGAEIKTAYQAEANAFTDTKNTKLASIEEGATAGGGGGRFWNNFYVAWDNSKHPCWRGYM